jgi:hypothetical protein
VKRTTDQKVEGSNPLFEVLENAVDSGNFHGCPFLNALGEMPDYPGVVHEFTVARHQVRQFFAGLLDPSLTEDIAGEVLDRLAIVHDGAYMGCKAEGSSKSALVGSTLAQTVVQSASTGRAF